MLNVALKSGSTNRNNHEPKLTTRTRIASNSRMARRGIRLSPPLAWSRETVGPLVGRPRVWQTSPVRKQYYFRESARGLLAWDVDRLVELTKSLPRKHVPLSAI